jgi:hypothetical protein
MSPLKETTTRQQKLSRTCPLGWTTVQLGRTHYPCCGRSWPPGLNSEHAIPLATSLPVKRLQRQCCASNAAPTIRLASGSATRGGLDYIPLNNNKSNRIRSHHQRLRETRLELLVASTASAKRRKCSKWRVAPPGVASDPTTPNTTLPRYSSALSSRRPETGRLAPVATWEVL